MGLVLYPSGLALVVLVPPLPAEVLPTEESSPLLELELLFVKL